MNREEKIELLCEKLLETGMPQLFVTSIKEYNYGPGTETIYYFSREDRDQLIALDLSGMLVSELNRDWLVEVPTWIDQFPELKRLGIRSAFLEHVEDQVFRNNTELVDLTLSGGFVREFKLENLNPLQKLKRLTLSGWVLLKAYDESNFIGLPNLENLRLLATGISSIPLGLISSEKLRYVDIEATRIQDLPDELYQLPLHTLSLKYNKYLKLSRDEILAKFEEEGNEIRLIFEDNGTEKST